MGKVSRNKTVHGVLVQGKNPGFSLKHFKKQTKGFMKGSDMIRFVQISTLLWIPCEESEKKKKRMFLFKEPQNSRISFFLELKLRKD